MKFGVVIFPGSNCDEDMIYTLESIMQQEVVRLWHKDKDLQGADIIALPGGFTYGDYLRTGALARFSPIMESVIRFAHTGGFVYGVCNGFQILCESGLLPGALMFNIHQKFICKNIYITADNNDCAYTSLIDTNTPLKMPIANGGGRYYADKETLRKMRLNGQILFRYCDENGKISDETNPNGSVDNIAGVCNEKKNVLGMMPHPERASDVELGNTDGRVFFESILKSLEKVEG